MRRRLVLLGWLAGLTQVQPVQAQEPTQPHRSAARWFTVAGSATDASADTVQVDPVAVRIEGPLKTMNVRVSRSRQRYNWERLPYRSYESQVLFDCSARKASYQAATFYAQPLWQGEPVKSVDYSGDPQPMRFLDMEPNPTQRIVRAVCHTSGG